MVGLRCPHRRVRVRRGSLRRRLASDAGFGLPEVMVAMGIVVTALVMLAHTVSVTLSDVGLARQRQGANAIANETIEQIRAIPQDTLRKGLRTSDLTGGDTNVTNCSGVYYFRSCDGEVIVHTAGLPDTPPLVPNRTTQTPAEGKTAYQVATYVTASGPDPATAPLRVIVIVTWDQVFRAAVSDTVEVETIIYEPSGCVDSATHPFAGPCQSFFFGTASGAKGSIKVEGTINGTPISALLQTLSTRADGQLEQVDHVQGADSAAGISLGTQTSGNEPATSSADDDPGTTSVGAYDSKTLNASSSSTLEQGVGGITVQVSNSSGTTGATTSATAAGVAQTCPTTTPPGSQTDGAPCGHTWAQQQGAIEAKLLLDSIASLGSATVAALGASPGASVSQIDRQTSGGDGTFSITGTRALGDLTIGGIPTGILTGIPAGWQGYFLRLSSFQDQVTAVVGDSTSKPSAAVTAGGLQVWNGTGYDTVPLGGTQPLDVSTGTVTLDDIPLLSNLVDLTISGSIRTGTVSEEDTAGGASGVKRTESSATSGSPLVGDITYNLVVRTVDVPPLIPSTEILNVSLKISIDLGNLFAQGNYREDPNG